MKQTRNLPDHSLNITTDKKKLDVNYVHRYLSEQSYWSKGIPLQTVIQSIRHSYAFGLFLEEKQIGFARVITDYSTFAYLADVFVDKHYQNQGLGKTLVQHILNDNKLQGIRRWMLMTLDAQSLYTKMGFDSLAHPERAMEITKPNIYNNPEKYGLPS